jgi:signal transduction histidine kinase
MRFDDRLQTATAMQSPNDGAESARWMHLVDLLAQPRSLSQDQRKSVLDEAQRLTAVISLPQRLSAALAVAIRVNSADLVELFANDIPRVAAPILLGAHLTDREWQALIPRLSPTSRALLRERRNLPISVSKALAAFGRSDFALADNRDVGLRQDRHVSRPHNEPQSGVSRISDLVAKIETWRSQRVGASIDTDEPRQRPAIDLIDHFQFETDEVGRIVWAYGAAQVSVIGISLADLADPICHGVDGQTAGAFAKRADINQGRLLLPDDTQLGGLWHVEARPLFAADTGKFRGYAGVAQRHCGDVAVTYPGSSQPEIMRQVVHELRSPLNAICGFAEMIAHQVAGPVPQEYRTRAASIVAEGGQMLALIESLDAAAQNTGSVHRHNPGQPNVPPLERASA